MFHVKGIPCLILFDQKGNYLSGDGRKIISMDQHGEYYPWTDISALEAEAGVGEDATPTLSQLDHNFLQYGMQLFGLTLNKEHQAGRLDDLSLRRNIELILALTNLINVVPRGKDRTCGVPPLLSMERNLALTRFPKGELFVSGADLKVPDVERYAGKVWVPQHPVVANLLGVPEKYDRIISTFLISHLGCSRWTRCCLLWRSARPFAVECWSAPASLAHHREPCCKFKSWRSSRRFS